MSRHIVPLIKLDNWFRKIHIRSTCGLSGLQDLSQQETSHSKVSFLILHAFIPPEVFLSPLPKT